MPIARWGKAYYTKKAITRNLPVKIGSFGIIKNAAVRKIIAAILVIFGAYALIYSPLFAINHVFISGNKVIGLEKINAAIDVVKKQNKWLFFPQNNIFFFDLNELRTQLNDTRLDSINIKKQPPGTLYVIIYEKKSMALWLSHDRYYDVDKYGKIIDEAVVDPAKEGITLPIITNKASVKWALAGESVANESILKIIAKLQSSLPEQLGLIVKLYDLSEAEQGKIIAHTSTPNMDIYFSTVNDLLSQLNKLRLFISDKERIDKKWSDDIKYIDLRFGSTRIYYE